jgi:hypothetical protein
MALTPLVLIDAKTYLDSADMTGYSNKVSLDAKAANLDRTTFASNGWNERVAGLWDGDSSIEGFYQAGDNSMPDDQIWGDLGNTVPLTSIPTAGTTAGDLAYVARVQECDYTFGAKVGELIAYSLSSKTNSPIARGKVLHPYGTARTTTGSGTGLQLGAVSAAQRLWANLHVMSISGTSTPTITCTIQSSVDNTFGSPTARISFAAATSIQGQALNVLGAVTDTWWRVIWTISGSSPSFLFNVSAGIGPK